jgi:hypothetical protein
MSDFNRIQVSQVNQESLSGFIQDTLIGKTGLYKPTGASGSFQFNSGDFFGATNLFFYNNKIGFGTSTPSYDFELNQKNLKVVGTGYFDDIYLGVYQVTTNNNLNASGTYLENLTTGEISSVRSLLETGYMASGYIESNYYPLSNPSGFITGSDAVSATGLNLESNIIANQVFS